MTFLFVFVCNSAWCSMVVVLFNRWIVDFAVQ
jgi:hypothetical protein